MWVLVNPANCINFYKHSYPIVPYRFLRVLILWFVMALQAMTPFVHAHAEPLQVSHADALPGHPGMPGDVAYHAIENSGQDAEIEVAEGGPFRQSVLPAAGAGASYPVPAVLPPEIKAGGRGAVWPVASSLHARLPAHALPHALAPPRR